MIVLGIDPGQANVGYAVLSWDGRVAKWIDGGKVLPHERNWPQPISQVDVVAIEWPSVGPRQASKPVMATMATAARIAGIAEALGKSVQRIPPAEWRKNVLGRTRRTETETIDAICNRVVTRLVIGIPSTNGHARDAVGVALMACRMSGSSGRAVEQEQAMQAPAGRLVGAQRHG